MSSSVLKKFKRFQNLLPGNPAMFCEIYFCKFCEVETNLKKKSGKKIIPQKLVLAKINFLRWLLKLASQFLSFSP